MEAAFAYNDYGELGEMGGKRRKAPHDRAGWKEMDENPGKKRRGRKAREGSGGDPVRHFTGPGPTGREKPDLGAGDGSSSAGNLERDLAEAQSTMGLNVGLTNEEGEALARAFQDHQLPVVEPTQHTDEETTAGQGKGGSG